MNCKMMLHKLLRYLYSLSSDVLLPLRLQAELDLDSRSVLFSDKHIYSTTITRVYRVLEQVSIDVWSETRNIVQDDLEQLCELQQHKRRLNRKLDIEELMGIDEKSEEDRLYRLRRQHWMQTVERQNHDLSDTISNEISKLRSRIRHEEMIAEKLIENKRKKCLEHLQQYYDRVQEDDDAPLLVDDKKLQRCADAGYEHYYRGYKEILREAGNILLTLE